jgi:hypothetical protein
MTKLISITDIVEFKPLSLNVNVAKQLDPYILEAQEFNLKPVLGDPLYLDLLENLENYDNLFLPYTYEWDGYKYAHNGIKASLIYWTYSRYLSNGNSHSTAFGMVQKLNEFSTPLDPKEISRQVKQTESGAIAYQQQYLEYLCRFATDYPLYNVGGKKIAQKTSNKIKSIGV